MDGRFSAAGGGELRVMQEGGTMRSAALLKCKCRLGGEWAVDDTVIRSTRFRRGLECAVEAVM
jgi:hypothetical protein